MGDTRRRTARRIAALTAALLCVVGLALPAAALPADPVGDARAQAAALRANVDRLTHQVAAANEDYDEAQARLGDAVTRHHLAARQLEQARDDMVDGGLGRAARARALYRAGGELGLLSTVLSARNINDALTRYRAVRRIVHSDDLAQVEARTFAGGAAEVERRLDGLRTQQATLERLVATRATRVRALLTQQASLLAAADAKVVRLAEQQRQAALSDAARRAAEMLAQAGALGNTPPTPQAAAAITAARSQIGKPYQWGATGTESFDCSGLTGWAYRQAGVNLPRTSRQQWFAGTHPELGQLAPGDLLFWADDLTDPATIHHVAMYIGGARMIAAPHTGALVREQAVYLDGFIGAVRPAY